MRKYLYIAVALIMSGCINDNITPIAPEKVETPNVIIAEDATEGEVIIKFKREMEAILDETMTRSGAIATRSGIPSTDEVLDILGAYHFERAIRIIRAGSLHALRVKFLVGTETGNNGHLTLMLS